MSKTLANDPIDKLRRDAYPNPERIGCPEPATFEALRQRKVAPDDPVWTHLDECSPCYREFAQIREELFKEERKQDLGRAARAGSVVVLVLVFGVSIFVWQNHRKPHSPNREAVETALVRFPEELTRRASSEDQAPPTDGDIQHVPRKMLKLTLGLPAGSPVGIYDLEITSLTGNAVWHSRGEAVLRNDVRPSIQIEADLRQVPAGEYKIRCRGPNDGWHETLASLR